MDQVCLGKAFVVTRAGKVLGCLVHPRDADIGHEILPDGSCPTLGIKLKEDEDENATGAE